MVGVGDSSSSASIGITAIAVSLSMIFNLDAIGHSNSQTVTFCQVLGTKCVRGSGTGLVINDFARSLLTSYRPA
jgi:hypothetical protein